MAVIKVFDSKGVKTVVLMGNVLEQDYDPIEEEEIDGAPEDTDAPE